MDLKPAETFDNQIKRLKSKEIIIDDFDECKNFLQKVNYYRFSAYYLPFLDRNTDKCFPNITFERIKKIYEFDQELRNLIMGAIEDIEVHLRTQISYYHSHTYGSDGYMDSKNFNARHEHQKFQKHVENCIFENKNTLVVQHHQKKYDGKFPLWVIIEFFSIGMLSHFYRSLKIVDKKYIAKSMYNVTYQIMDSWMRCLTDLRNKCAHYTRLYYWKFSAKPKMPTDVKYIPTRRLFAQLYMLKLMYPDTEKWNTYYVKSIYKLIKKYKPHISLKHLDFPYRWKSMLTK